MLHEGARRVLGVVGGALAALAISIPAFAQAPVVTPAGDPSVKNDTIYSLVVKAADHPEENYVVLLDDGILRYEKDGTGTRTYRSVVQLLKSQAVDQWAEQTIAYDADRESFTLNWARVLDADGKVVSAEPLHVQEVDAEVPEGSPIYTHQKNVRISLASATPGRIVDFSYTVKVNKAELAGDFIDTWGITTGGTIRRSRFLVDLPSTMKPHIHERNMQFKPAVQTANGRTVRTWATGNMEYIQPELFASDSNSVLQSLALSGEDDWQTVSKWYAGLAKDRYTVTPAIRKWVDSVTAGSADPVAKLRAVHRAIAQDI